MMVHVDAAEVEKESEVEAFAVQNESPASDLNQSDDNKGDVYDEIAEEVDEFVQKDDPQTPTNRVDVHGGQTKYNPYVSIAISTETHHFNVLQL